jgi:hypothetical protein
MPGDLAVPIWGRFMKEATEGDQPRWFRPPSGVSSAHICRISGKLPVDGCRSVISTADDGTLTVKSAVYTEYFIRGTEPIDYCPVHGFPGFGDTIVGTGGELASPPPATPASPAEVRPASPTNPLPSPAAEPEPKKKRGFWSRFFGLSDDKPKPPKKPPQQP